MRLWPWRRQQRAVVEGGVRPTDEASIIRILFGAGDTDYSVTPDTATRAATVYACTRVLAETLGMLPVQIFRRTDSGERLQAREHRLWPTLTRRPNGWLTPQEWREIGTQDMCLRGAAYYEIRQRGRQVELDRLPTHLVEPSVVAGRIGYDYQAPGGRRRLLQDEVLRVSYLTRDGVRPISPVRHHADTIGLALSATSYARNFLANGGRPPGILKAQGALNKEQRDTLIDWFAEQFRGRKAGGTPVVPKGLEYEAIGISNSDAQLLEMARWTVTEICRIYRVPPHMVQDLSQAKWANIEAQQIDFVVHTITPWVTRWEQSLTRSLLTDDEQDEYYVEFNLRGLLRGDTLTRYQAYGLGRQWGWLSANDIRTLENQPQIEGGDVYLSPSNMQPSTQVAGKDNGDQA